MKNLLADEKLKSKLGNNKKKNKYKYPGHMKFMQDLKSVRAKVEVKKF